MEANNLMVVNSTDGQSSEILGKFLYYSFPRLLINKKEFKELVEKYMVFRQVKEKNILLLTLFAVPLLMLRTEL